MKAIIAVSSQEPVDVDETIAWVGRLRRRILTAFRATSVSDVLVIVPAELAEWSRQLLTDDRIPSRVQVHVHHDVIHQLDSALVAHVIAVKEEPVVLVSADIYSPSLLDRLSTLYAAHPDTPLTVVDSRQRPILTACTANELGTVNDANAVSSIRSLIVEEAEYGMLVSSKSDIEIAERIIRSNMTRKGDGWVSKYLNRPISTRVSWQLMKLGISPNAVTAFTIALGLLACVLNVHGSPPSIGLGAFLFYCSSIFDGCDGEIARTTFTDTPFGKWFDNVGDCVVSTFYVASFGFGFWWLEGDITMLCFSVWGFVFAWLGIGIYFATLRKRGQGSMSALLKHSKESTHPFVIALRPVTHLFRREYFSLLLVVGVLIGLREVIVYVSTLNNTLFFLVAVLGNALQLFRASVEK